MALISTLRKRMGKIVVGFVAFSMFAFILTDLFQSNSALLGGNDRTVAEIAGTDISYEQFQQKVDELSYVFAVNNNRDPRAEEQETIREQAWNALIIDYAYKPQFEKLGIQVTDAEVIDMVQGNNIDPQIKQFFTDPNTGEFKRENVINFLQQMNNAQPQQRASWMTFEQGLKPNRRIKKYESLLEQTAYVTKAEAKSKYVAQESNMTVDYVYVPFFSVADSMFSVSDSEMESYLSENEEQYQRDESRNLSYVVFPIQPSAEDSAYAQEEIQKLAQGLANAEDDSTFAVINSDAENAFRTIADPSLVPEGLVGAEEGTVTAPQLVGDNYVVSKLSAITEGDEAFVKARHILIEMDGNSDAAIAEAKSKAQDIIRQLRRGADFAELAAINSADQSNAANGGDLGWFGENGSFVQPFKDAVFAHKGTGVLPQPVETSFGYHVIKIDEPKTTTAYKVATIQKALFESDNTLNEIYRQADLLAANSDDYESLKQNAADNGVTVRNASNIGPNDSRVGIISDARSVVLWLYNDASVNEVSDVFEMDDNYVVAVMTGRQMEGTAKLSQVRSEIRTKVLNQKKADYIKEKLSAISAEDFEAIASEYGEGARSGSSDLTLSSNSFPNVGFAPEAVGVAFSLEEGEGTAPFEAPNGVLMVKAVAKSMAADQEDYSAYVAQVENERRVRKAVIANFPLSFSPMFVSQAIDQAVKEFAEIEDTRYKFF
ncbi:peptidylprolyl isomerase [Marinoscillum furvescens]|uniref:Periplasmic chaperone PpiD n=1 Tax=Marinoscillum furvescens DSM 4134 TaxID=1122208 RepID=A0A3D9L4C5_MARFU|nr:peptidylprolyl isomerase [Marinoscillum furvescens]RED98856.1 peptidyl-prolyl cis-trans isomerase D [Marinoscillum furvescens DSM 4134]